MKEVKNIELVKVLKYKDKYFIYAFKEDDHYELYLKHEDYGIMVMMIGAPIEQQSLDTLIAISEIDDYVEEYKERYEDDDCYL